MHEWMYECKKGRLIKLIKYSKHTNNQSNNQTTSLKKHLRWKEKREK